MTDKRRFKIRDAVPQDVSGCLQLDHNYETEIVWQVHLREDVGERTITFRETRLPRLMDVTYPKNEGRLKQALSPTQCFLVATDQSNKAMGYLVMLADSTHGQASIRDVVVTSDYRRRGLGLRLMTIAQHWAREHGLNRITAITQTKNHPGIGLCQRAGFIFCGYNDQYFTNQDIAVFFCLSLR